MAKDSNKGKFFEDGLRIRIKGKPSVDSEIGVASPSSALVNILNCASSGKYIDLTEFQQFRTIGADRNEQYRCYDEMAQDAIIASALEMYADDATQYNAKGEIIWAESENTDVARFANRLINILGLNEDAWSHIYALVKYGDCYLQLFKDDEEINDLVTNNVNASGVETAVNRTGSRLEEYIEMVANPARMFDLASRGKTVGFVEVELYDNIDNSPTFQNYTYNTNDNNIRVYDPKKYVHIMLNPNTNRFPEKFTIDIPTSDKEGISKSITTSYDVKRGKSILYDVYKIYREIQLMEDSILLNRVTRSSIIRLLQIEVGDMPQNQVEQLLHRVKRLVEQKNFMDKDAGTFSSSASPAPIDNVLYIPTRDGKGTISMSNLGGDVDVKSIADMDYFKNKLFGALKIPKQFLGEDEGGGFSGGTSLTKLDARYARTIKRIQNAYISGITTLINLFALSKGLTQYVNAFTIRMVSPSTTEEAERDETFNNRIDIVDRFLGLIPEDMISPKKRKEILVYYISKYFNEPDVAQMIEEDDTLDEVPEDELDDMDMESHGGGGGFSSPSTDIDFDMGGGGDEDFGAPEDIGGSEPDVGGAPEPDVDMGDIEI